MANKGPRRVRSIVWIDPGLHRIIKVAAAMLGLQIGDVVDDLIRQAVPELRRRAAKAQAKASKP